MIDFYRDILYATRVETRRLAEMRPAKYILFALLVALVLFALWVGPADAVTYSGGTAEQRAYAQEIIESCWLDYTWIDARVDEVDVLIEEHHDPYWDLWDETAWSVAGLASFGQIWVDAKYPPGYDSFFGEIIAHEWSHQLWFAMHYSWKQDWIALCTDGSVEPSIGDWYRSPTENFAECVRVALFAPEYHYNDLPRTNLVVVSPEATREFLTLWRWGYYCTFYDLLTEDSELRAAAGYLKEQGIIKGYEDHTFGPYNPLLKRHVALICERAGLIVPGWVNDYTPATRGEVRDNIPGLAWDSERWSESISRSQLARLLWRAR